MANFIISENKKKEWRDAIVKQRHKMICLNDDLENITKDEFLSIKEEMKKAFEMILGEKSSYERQ